MNWTLIIGIITGIIIPVLGYHLHGYDKTKENLYSKIHDLESELTKVKLNYIHKTDLKEKFGMIMNAISELKADNKSEFKAIREEIKEIVRK